MKKFIYEFKEFAIRGNVIDLAVGVVIGGAFKGIVDSLVNNIITPFIGIFANQDFSDKVFLIGDVAIKYGSFVSSIINFVLMALVVFIMVKVLNTAQKKMKPKEEAVVTTKKCKYCISTISIEATRCPHCTSILEEV